jgi:outer membrane lipoprotein-sorting protein
VANRPDPDFEWLAIAVDPVSYQIRFLVALDRQGGRSTFAFSNLKENQRPPDTLFAFQIPRGVDVIKNAR